MYSNDNFQSLLFFSSSQNKIKVVALKITNNINVLIKVTLSSYYNSESFSAVMSILNMRSYLSSLIFSRICFITLHPIKAQSLCPGNRCRRQRRRRQQLGTSTKQLRHPDITVFSLLIKVFFFSMISIYPTARRGTLEKTSGQQQQQRSFPQLCPGGTPGKYTIHPAGNTVPALGTSHTVSV